MLISSPSVHIRAPRNLLKRELDLLPDNASLADVIFMVNCLIGRERPDLLRDKVKAKKFGTKIEKALEKIHKANTNA